MIHENPTEKRIRYQAALEQFVERLQEDRYVLGLVLVGSLREDTMWQRESLHVWIIESDGVTRRLRSDGNDERIHRILVENSIAIFAEVIPRSRFKQMVEGSSRTAFSCNFFAERTIVYSCDAALSQWFDDANSIAVKDQERELLAFTTWTIHALRSAKRWLEIKQDREMAFQATLGAAHSIAYTEIIRAGEVCETDVMLRALHLNPLLFQTIYRDVLNARLDDKVLNEANTAIDDYLCQHFESHLKPLLAYLRKQNRTCPLSEISDFFAMSQIHPWHIESSCDWLEERGALQKISAPFKLTKRSANYVEEPAYFIEN